MRTICIIGREPGPGLRMFTAKFISLVFPDTLGHNKFVMITPNSVYDIGVCPNSIPQCEPLNH